MKWFSKLGNLIFALVDQPLNLTMIGSIASNHQNCSIKRCSVNLSSKEAVSFWRISSLWGKLFYLAEYSKNQQDICKQNRIYTIFVIMSSSPRSPRWSGELCDCKEQVTGRICDSCKPLYWNLASHLAVSLHYHDHRHCQDHRHCPNQNAHK